MYWNPTASHLNRDLVHSHNLLILNFHAGVTILVMYLFVLFVLCCAQSGVCTALVS
jgi:hypothetical protein